MATAFLQDISLLSIPDDTLVDIATFLPTAKDLAVFSSLCRHLRWLICHKPLVLAKILHNRCQPHHVRSLIQLHWVEAIMQAGLLRENRLGYSVAATEVDSDNQGLIKGSTTRMATVRSLLRRFPESQITIEAHCGTMAPPEVSVEFSRVRGMSLMRELFQYDEEVLERLTLRAWGRQVADEVALMKHPNQDVARCGLGWAEVYMEFQQLMLPPRPKYYPDVSTTS